MLLICSNDFNNSLLLTSKNEMFNLKVNEPKSDSLGISQVIDVNDTMIELLTLPASVVPYDVSCLMDVDQLSLTWPRD